MRIMSDENQAALVEPLDAFVQGDDQPQTEAPKANGVQERINKITADKHEERRQREAEAKRADGLQKQLDEIQAKKPTLMEPTLEGHDYDDVAFNTASVAFQVQEQVKAELVSQKAKQEQLNQQASAQEVQTKFNERATALGKDDFDAKANAIPELPAGVVDAIMGLENGAEMVYHLGTHLDKADSLANMSPMAAMMEIGRISASMSIKPETKTSAAPDPITPLSSGGSTLEVNEDDMSMAQWMAANNG